MDNPEVISKNGFYMAEDLYYYSEIYKNIRLKWNTDFDTFHKDGISIWFEVYTPELSFPHVTCNGWYWIDQTNDFYGGIELCKRFLLKHS